MTKIRTTRNIHASAELEERYKSFSAMDCQSLLTALDCTDSGLTDEEAQKRLLQYELNQINDNKKTPWYIFLIQILCGRIYFSTAGLCVYCVGRPTRRGNHLRFRPFQRGHSLCVGLQSLSRK